MWTIYSLNWIYTCCAWWGVRVVRVVRARERIAAGRLRTDFYSAKCNTSTTRNHCLHFVSACVVCPLPSIEFRQRFHNKSRKWNRFERIQPRVKLIHTINNHLPRAILNNSIPISIEINLYRRSRHVNVEHPHTNRFLIVLKCPIRFIIDQWLNVVREYACQPVSLAFDCFQFSCDCDYASTFWVEQSSSDYEQQRM